MIFTEKEIRTIKKQALENLDYCYENLRGKSIKRAMAIFDNWSWATILKKIDPKEYNKIRENVIQNIQGY